MRWCLRFAVVLSVVVAGPASMSLAQINLRGIIGGFSERTGPGNGTGHIGGHDDEHDGGHPGGQGPSITFPPINSGHGHGQGIHTPSPPMRIPFPTRPTHTNAPHYPKPNYMPRPDYPPRLNYTPKPNYVPMPKTTTVPSNVLPPQPETPVQPEANVVLVTPEPNDFLGDLGVKPITPEQAGAFKKQLAEKNKQLADELKKLFPGNDQAIDQLVASANGGQLNARAVQRFILILGGNLGLPLQLKATGLIKQLVFNNLAMAALLNVNFNLLNVNFVNINLVNVNVNVLGGGMGGGMGGGVLGGFWGFPQWPWAHPVWLGPGIWWGPCAYCPHPYYNPRLNGAAVLGIPYSVAAPVSGYSGRMVSGGILLTNGGGSAVNYTVDGRRYALEPGYRQTVARSRIVIAFDRGGSFGRAKYGIDEGWYKFTATEQGWELYKQTAMITLDNTENTFPFRYVLDNRQQTLQAGYRQQHTGRYPLELKFSDGKGQIIRKILAKGEFSVAVGPSGGLDLFRPEDVIPPAPIAEMSKQAEETTRNIFAEPETIPNLFGETAAGVTPAQPSGPVAPPAPSLFGSES